MPTTRAQPTPYERGQLRSLAKTRATSEQLTGCVVFECARRSVRQRWRWVVGVCGRPKARVCVRLCCNGRFRESSRSSAHSRSTAWQVAPVPVSSGQPKTKHAPSTLTVLKPQTSNLKPYHQTISSHRVISSPFFTITTLSLLILSSGFLCFSS